MSFQYEHLWMHMYYWKILKFPYCRRPSRGERYITNAWI